MSFALCSSTRVAGPRTPSRDCGESGCPLHKRTRGEAAERGLCHADTYLAGTNGYADVTHAPTCRFSRGNESMSDDKSTRRKQLGRAFPGTALEQRHADRQGDGTTRDRQDEVDRIGRRLKARSGEADPDRAWREEVVRHGGPHRASRQGCGEGRDITAGNHYMRAGTTTTARAIHPAGRGETRVLARALVLSAAMARSIRDRAGRGAYEGASLPPGRQRPRRRTPPDGRAVRRHGQRQGDERDLRRARFRAARIHRSHRRPANRDAAAAHHRSRHDYEVPGTAAYDYVAGRPEVDPSASRSWATARWLPGAAHRAFEKRYAAAVAFGAMH